MQSYMLTVDGYADIAFRLPELFKEKYRSVPKELWVSILKSTNKNGTKAELHKNTSVMHRLVLQLGVPSAEPKIREILNYLANELTSNEILEVCQALNNKNQTFLHTLAITDHTGSTFKKFLNAMNDDTFKKMYTMQDSSGSNFLHVTATHQSIENQAAVLEKLVKPENFFASEDYRKAFSQTITFDNLTFWSLMSRLPKQTFFTKAEYEKNSADLQSKLYYMKEIIENCDTAEESFLRLHYNLGYNELLPAIIYDIRFLASICKTSNYHDKGFDSEAGNNTKGTARELITSLFAKIDPKAFDRAFDAISSLDTDDEQLILEQLRVVLLNLDFIPYLYQDPVKVFGLFINDLTPKLTFSNKTKSFKYQQYLFNPEKSVLNDPEGFTNYLEIVVEYQKTSNRSTNGYQTILATALEALAAFSTNPSCSVIHHECRDDLEKMLQALQKKFSVTKSAPVEIEMSDMSQISYAPQREEKNEMTPKEIFERNWNNQMCEFEAYLKQRSKVQPGIFTNTKKDYEARKKCFNKLNRATNNKQRIKIIEESLQSRTINPFFNLSHRTVDYLKRLKNLIETVNSTPKVAKHPTRRMS